MKHLLAVLLFVTVSQLVFAQDTLAADTLLDQKIERLLELSGARNQFATAIDQMINLQKGNPVFVEVLPADFWTEFAAETHRTGYESLLPEMIAVYRSHLTEAEIDHQIAYFSSPLTQGIVAKQGAMMQESMQIGATWGAALGEDIARRLQEAAEGRE